ncbi:MAG: 2-C-methyl-D-erythritol 4-phosphate cytidylyltransferase [Oscillospiraceae bacterium]|nr:2-C-methyl-D-erythritol 4-phosphate cytidylyltransferase [Oscillospiraceae bacterium]
MRKDTAALLVCAGSASRMGGINKILHPLGRRTVLEYGLSSFCQCGSIAEIVIVVRADEIPKFQELLSRISIPLPVKLAAGGNTRQESVKNGFSLISPDCQYAAIHDGARPLIRPAAIERVIADARRTGAATLGVPVKDTIKIVKNGIITDTPERSMLYQTQTPQVFSVSLYAEAMQLAKQQGRDYTDDCQLVEALGTPVTMTAGDYTNLKLTTPEDFAVAEALLAEREKEEHNG